MMMKLSAPLKKHSFMMIFLVYLLINLGLDFSETLVSPYAKTLGATPVIVGVVATGFVYGSIIYRFLSGPAIDYFNRKSLLLIAVSLITISFFGEAFATSVPVLLAFRIMQGIGQAFTAPICLTLATSAISRKNLAGGLGTLAVARGIATLVAPVIALKISESTSYRASFLIAAVIESISIIAILNLPDSKPRRLQGQKFKISFSGFIAIEAIPPALMQFFFMMAWSCVFAFLVIFGQEQGLGSNVGFFNTAYGLAIFVSAPLGGRLVDRFGYYMLLPMLLMMTMSLWLISFSTNLGLLILAAVIGAFGYGAAGPVVRSIAMGIVPENRQGAASSTLYIASDIGQLAGPVVGGLLVSYFGYATMFRIAPIWVVMATILFLLTKSFVQKKIMDVQIEIDGNQLIHDS